MKRLFLVTAGLFFVILAGCSSPKIGHGESDAWASHDLQLAEMGKARFVQCLAEPDYFGLCVEDIAALLDSWCRIYDPTESKACLVLDDIMESI